MKKIILISLVTLNFTLHAQWTRVYESKNTQMGIQRNDNDYFWIEGGTLISASLGKVLELTVSGSRRPIRFQMSFSNIEHGFLTVEYSVIFRFETEFYETHDAGKTWTSVAMKLPAAISPTTYPLNSQLLYTDQKNYLQSSIQGSWLGKNNGGTWQRIEIAGDTLLAPIYFDKEQVVLTSFGSGIWRPFEPQKFQFYNLDIHSGEMDLFFHDDSGILSGDSNTGSYFAFAKMVKTKNGRCYLLFHEYIPGCGLFYNGSFLFYTDDHGKTWKYRKFKLGENSFEAPGNLLFCGNDTAFISCNAQVYRSTDGGLHWDTFTRSIRENASDYSEITDLFLVGNILFATTEKASLLGHSSEQMDASLVQKHEELSAYLVHPNPVRTGEIIYLKTPTVLSANAQFRLYNNAGGLAAQGLIDTGGKCTLPILPAGAYVFCVQDLKYSFNQCLIIQ